MKILQTVFSFVLIEVCWTLSTVSLHERNPYIERTLALFEALGYSASCASATLTACSTNCRHDFHSSVWRAKQSVDIAAIGLEDAILQLSKAVSCLPFPNLPPSRLVSSPPLVTPADFFPRDCVELRDSGYSISGVYEIYPYLEFPNDTEEVFCDQETDGGGWIVIQRREEQQPRENFNRKWKDYYQGFGSRSNEFWLGLELIHILTKGNSTEMRVDLEDAKERKRYAKYKHFSIGNLTSQYVLSIDDYSGDAGDSLEFHNNNKFSTLDQDNDNFKLSNCAKQNKGGWWFNSCMQSNLNGYQYIGKGAPHAQGIVWLNWHGYGYSLARASMKIRSVWEPEEEQGSAEFP